MPWTLTLAQMLTTLWNQMKVVLRYVAKRAGFDLPDQANDKIVVDSEGNMRKAILVLEALKMQSYAISLVIFEPV